MNLLNNANFIGRIVDESIQVQQISSNLNVVVTYFKIAINKGFIDKQTKQWTDKTQFTSIKEFGAKDFYIAKNFNKDNLVALKLWDWCK